MTDSQRLNRIVDMLESVLHRLDHVQQKVEKMSAELDALTAPGRQQQ